LSGLRRGGAGPAGACDGACEADTDGDGAGSAAGVRVALEVAVAVAVAVGVAVELDAAVGCSLVRPSVNAIPIAAATPTAMTA
jgi:hypothetical protein